VLPALVQGGVLQGPAETCNGCGSRVVCGDMAWRPDFESKISLHIGRAGQPPAWAGAFQDSPNWRWFFHKAHTLQKIETFKAPAGGQAGAARSYDRAGQVGC